MLTDWLHRLQGCGAGVVLSSLLFLMILMHYDRQVGNPLPLWLWDQLIKRLVILLLLGLALGSTITLGALFWQIVA